MNKWTWLSLVAFVAVLGGSYYLLSTPKSKIAGEMGKTAEGELNVEDFDAADAGDEGDRGGDNTYDMLDDPDAGQGTPGGAGDKASAARGAKKPGNQVETIDDADDKGETVSGPVVIEDNDVSIEPAKPKSKP